MVKLTIYLRERERERKRERERERDLKNKTFWQPGKYHQQLNVKVKMLVSIFLETMVDTVDKEHITIVTKRHGEGAKKVMKFHFRFRTVLFLSHQ